MTGKKEILEVFAFPDHHPSYSVSIVIGNYCSNGCQTFHKDEASEVFRQYGVPKEYQDDILNSFRDVEIPTLPEFLEMIGDGRAKFKWYLKGEEREINNANANADTFKHHIYQRDAIDVVTKIKLNKANEVCKESLKTVILCHEQGYTTKTGIHFPIRLSFAGATLDMDNTNKALEILEIIEEMFEEKRIVRATYDALLHHVIMYGSDKIHQRILEGHPSPTILIYLAEWVDASRIYDVAKKANYTYGISARDKHDVICKCAECACDSLVGDALSSMSAFLRLYQDDLYHSIDQSLLITDNNSLIRQGGEALIEDVKAWRTKIDLILSVL